MEHFGLSLNYAFTILVGLDLFVLVDTLVALNLLEELSHYQVKPLHLPIV